MTAKEMRRLSERHTATLHALLDMRRELVDSVLIHTKEVHQVAEGHNRIRMCHLLV